MPILSPSADDLSPAARPVVMIAGVALIALQTAFCAWALFPSWFYTDDYRLLVDARREGFDWSYLMSPFDSQFMPVGRALASLVASAEGLQWPLAAMVILATQVLASAACLWMLVTLFGTRWGAVGLLALYVGTAITMPAMMWWAASLNQLPLQAVFFAATAAGVRYLRGRSLWWLVGTMLLLCFGLLAYVKSVLVFGVLGFIAVAYFARGTATRRLAAVIRQFKVAVVAAGAIAAVYAVYYTSQVPPIFEDGEAPIAGDLASTMLGTALPVGLIGGPWRWDTSNPPTGYADPPSWAVHASWVVIVLLALYLALTRQRTGRAWILLGGYTGAAYGLLLTSRAPVAGSGIGLEYRYLTDVAAVAVLCVGLASMRLLGAPESSEPREQPLLLVSAPRRLTVALVATAVISGLLSSASYARTWHNQNPGAAYLSQASSSLETQGVVDLADQVVPSTVMPGYSYPYNRTSVLLPLMLDDARFPDVTDRLAVLDEDGTPRRAAVDAVSTAPPGPRPGCGWRVTAAGRTIPLEQPTFDYTWWVRIGYLGSADDEIEVTLADTTVGTEVRRGLHSLYVEVTGEVDSVTLDGLSPGTTVCVDTVEVGTVVPGGPL